MKIYTVFLFNPDEPNQYGHLIGSFDSKEKYQKAIDDIATENDVSLEENVDFEVITAILNENNLKS